MALPRTIVELLDRSKLSATERISYERKVYSILSNIRTTSQSTGYEAGYEAGYAVGLDEGFNITETTTIGKEKE